MDVEKIIYNIQDLIKNVDWLTNKPGAVHGPRLGDDQVFVSFAKHTPKADKVNEVRVRFGAAILKRLNWNFGDKVIIESHPDDLMLFKIFKPDTRIGYTLSKDGKSARAYMRWQYDLPLEEKRYELVKHAIYNERIIVFRVGPVEFVS